MWDHWLLCTHTCSYDISGREFGGVPATFNFFTGYLPAGYGRKEVAELLIAAGAKLDAVNGEKQTPLDVAKLNREVRGALGMGFAVKPV